MRHRALAFVALASLGVGLRLLLALNPPASVSHSVDLDSYSIVADVLRSGKPLYESTDRYHYPPLWAGALEIFDTISRISKTAFPTVVRTFLTGVDLASAFLLWSIARWIGVSARRSVALFLFNPLSARVTGVRGQFAPGLGAQYLVWPLMLGALRNGSGYLLCTASSILWILGSHYGLAGSGRWMGHLVWLSVAFWLSRELARVRRGELSDRKVPA